MNFKFLSSIVDSSYISKSATGAVSYNFSPVYIPCTSSHSCIQEIPEAMVCPTSADILLYPSPDASLLLQKVLLQKSPDDLPVRPPGQNSGETAVCSYNCENGSLLHLPHNKSSIPPARIMSSLKIVFRTNPPSLSYTSFWYAAQTLEQK